MSRPLRVYVAAAWREAERASAAIAAVRAAGCEITKDWTLLVDEYPNDDAPEHVRMREAWADVVGVREADVLLVLTPCFGTPTTGIWVELGVALTEGVPVILAGPQRARNIFCSLSMMTVEHDAAAIGLAVSLKPRPGLADYARGVWPAAEHAPTDRPPPPDP